MEIAWRPGIGDPTVTGWLTVFLYAIAAVLAVTLASAFRKPIILRQEARFWALIALTFAALSINKQLDLQSLMTDIGRVMAREQGWYDTRRQAQEMFITGVGAGAALSFLVIVVLWWRSPWPNRIAQVGTALVIAFVAIRASSFHGMDRLISTEIAPYIRMNAVLEIGGISLVLIGSSLRLRQAMRRLRTDREARFGLPS
ncbi:MAG: hypothetical protein AAFR65_01070 [Pseudomonadota bacterium]